MEELYKIIRFYQDVYHPNHRTVILEDLSLEAAKAYCTREETHSQGKWFDGFEQM
jgi:hypothetical protein